MPELLFKFKRGINEINYDEMRWAGLHSYLFPTWQSAVPLVEHLENLDKYKCVDLILERSRLMNHVHYPAIFEQRRELMSQIDKHLYAGERKSMI